MVCNIYLVIVKFIQIYMEIRGQGNSNFADIFLLASLLLKFAWLQYLNWNIWWIVHLDWMKIFEDLYYLDCILQRNVQDNNWFHGVTCTYATYCSKTRFSICAWKETHLDYCVAQCLICMWSLMYYAMYLPECIYLLFLDRETERPFKFSVQVNMPQYKLNPNTFSK